MNTDLSKVEQVDENSDSLRATQIDYARALLRSSFPSDFELVESLNFGGVNEYSIESRARLIQPLNQCHFNTFCLSYLRGIAIRLGHYDIHLLEALIGSENDSLNGPIKDSLKLVYALKYPQEVTCLAYEI